MNPGRGVRPLRQRDYGDVGNGIEPRLWTAGYVEIARSWRWASPWECHNLARPTRWKIETIRQILRGDE